MTTNLNMWILEKTKPMTIWCSLDADLCMVDFYMSFAGEIRHDRLVKVTQDELIVAMADKYDTPENRAWIKDELESEKYDDQY